MLVVRLLATPIVFLVVSALAGSNLRVGESRLFSERGVGAGLLKGTRATSTEVSELSGSIFIFGLDFNSGDDSDSGKERFHGERSE